MFFVGDLDHWVRLFVALLISFWISCVYVYGTNKRLGLFSDRILITAEFPKLVFLITVESFCKLIE